MMRDRRRCVSGGESTIGFSTDFRGGGFGTNCSGSLRGARVGRGRFGTALFLPYSRERWCVDIRNS
jgi:hypothetical protein